MYAKNGFRAVYLCRTAEAPRLPAYCLSRLARGESLSPAEDSTSSSSRRSYRRLVEGDIGSVSKQSQKSAKRQVSRLQGKPVKVPPPPTPPEGCCAAESQVTAFLSKQQAHPSLPEACLRAVSQATVQSSPPPPHCPTQRKSLPGTSPARKHQEKNAKHKLTGNKGKPQQALLLVRAELIEIQIIIEDVARNDASFLEAANRNREFKQTRQESS